MSLNDSDLISIMACIKNSKVNGPGNRFVIWFQGCPHACLGCFNPSSWKFTNKNLISIDQLVNDIKLSGTDGLTISGGEPMAQPEQLLGLLRALNDDIENILPKGIIVFSGYRLEEILENQIQSECLKYIDLLIDGRYVDELKITDALSGSSNQRFHFSKLEGRGKARIPEETVITDQAVELHLSSGSDVIETTGFPSIDKSRLKELGIRILP